MEKISCIYRILNIKNTKSYIGSAIDFNRRKRRHLNLLRNNNHHSFKLQNSFNKYGEENFIFEILEIVTDIENIIKIEQKWIDLEIPLLNMTLIAGLNSSMGMKRSDETRNKIKLSLTGKKLSIETKEKISKTLKGRKLNEEHKKNIKNALNNSEKFKESRKDKKVYEKIRNTRLKNNNYTIRDETKQKIRETLKSKKLQSAVSITIDKYSLDGILLESYPSMAKAEKSNNLGRSSLYYNIVKCKKLQYMGFVWIINKN